MSKFRRGRRTSNGQENAMVKLVDQLSAFEKFKELIPPELRAMLAEGASAKRIMTKYKAFAAARLVADSVDVLSKSGAGSAKEILNRLDGKPTEKTEVMNKYDNLPPSQLEALIATRQAELDALEGTDAAPAEGEGADEFDS